MISAPPSTGSISMSEALRTVTVNSSYHASRALSKWFRRGVRLTCDGFAETPLHELADALGEADSCVAAIHMALEGELSGDVLLAFPEATALALADLLMGSPPGTARSLGEIERSALQETGNILGSALTNSLASWLKLDVRPSAPVVLHDLAGAVIQPLVVQHVAAADSAFLTQTEFELDGSKLDFRMLLLPAPEAMALIRSKCQADEVQANALHTLAINAAFDASRAMSKWLRKGVRLQTDGFVRVPLAQVTASHEGDAPVVAMHAPLVDQMHGHILMLMSMRKAGLLVDRLMGQPDGTTTEFGDMARSCLQETGNIISSAFINSWAKWLDIHCEPASPQVLVDLPESILESALIEQAQVGDEALLALTEFSVDGQWLEWELFVLPTPASLRLIEAFCA